MELQFKTQNHVGFNVCRRKLDGTSGTTLGQVGQVHDHTKEVVIIEAQLEKHKVSPNECSSVRAMVMNDEGYSELLF